MIRITDLNVAPEVFEAELLSNLPELVASYSEMGAIERAFINGMIRIFRPQRILELGVAEGAGSAVVLNAIFDMPDATLTSFDVAVAPRYTPYEKVGFVVESLSPALRKKWELFTKADFSQFASTFEKPFDFVIIDTAHIHPVESLNFLSVLPYLTEDAIVIFHDLNLYMYKAEEFSKFPACTFANKFAFDTLVGDKLFPQDEDYLQYGASGLGAIQISEDTRKYIGNLFNMLFFPWADYVNTVLPYLRNIIKIVKEHYSQELFRIFVHAVIMNVVLTENHNVYKENVHDFFDITNSITTARKYIFYGAGKNCLRIMEQFKAENIAMPNEIWDIEGGAVQSLLGIRITSPRFEKLNSDDCQGAIVVITIGDSVIADGIKKKILEVNPALQVVTYEEMQKYLQYVKIAAIIEKI